MNKCSNEFEQYIMKRCEEIISGDISQYNLNNRIIEIEKRFMETLTNEQIQMYLELEMIVIQQKETCECLLYSKGLEDQKTC